MGYDPTANPTMALAAAKLEADKSGRRVLVIAGGDWCGWCHVLDKYISENRDVQSALDRAFVIVKVYYGDENHNDAFFANLPPAKGYPYFWVIGKDGVARPYGMGTMDDGAGGYDKSRFLQFIRDASKG